MYRPYSYALFQNNDGRDPDLLGGQFPHTAPLGSKWRGENEMEHQKSQERGDGTVEFQLLTTRSNITTHRKQTERRPIFGCDNTWSVEGNFSLHG